MTELTPHQRTALYKIIGLTKKNPLLTSVQLSEELKKVGLTISPQEIVYLCAEVGYSAVETAAYIENEKAILEFMVAQLSMKITRNIDGTGSYEDNHLFVKLNQLASILTKKYGSVAKKGDNKKNEDDPLGFKFVKIRNKLHEERYDAGMERRGAGNKEIPAPPPPAKD